MIRITMWLAACLVAVVTVGCGTVTASQPGGGTRTTASFEHATASATAGRPSQVSSAVTAGTGVPAACRRLAGKSLLFTLASNRKTICVRVGTQMDVYLQGTRSQPWQSLVTTGHALTGIPNGTFSLPVGVTAASYAAVRSGESLIVSIRLPCRAPVKNGVEPAFPLPGPYPSRLCAPDRVFVIAITVVGLPPAASGRAGRGTCARTPRR
jgi:hypothetical protein